MSVSPNKNFYSDIWLNFSQNSWDGCSPYGQAAPGANSSSQTELNHYKLQHNKFNHNIYIPT